MQITRKVTPGRKDAEKLLGQYGAKLIHMRYRHNDQKRKRFNTI